MDVVKANRIRYNSAPSESMHGGMVAAVTLISIAFLGAVFWWNLDQVKPAAYNELYLFPWILLVGAVIAAPTVVLYYQRKLDFFHPLVFAAWSYFVPAFVIGGFILTFGIAQAVPMHLIESPEYNLPLTCVYIALGFGGLSLGFIVPWARRLGQWLSARVVPQWNWKDSDTVFPSVVLLGIGIFFLFSAWISGSIGYQKINLSDDFSSANYFISTVMLQASFIIWLFIFRARKFDAVHAMLLGAILISVLARMTLGGNKSILLYSLILVIMAYVYSGRRLKFKQGAVFAVIGVMALVIGIIYGLTFRQLKVESEENISFSLYMSHVGQAVSIITTQDPTQTLSDGLAGLAERFEIVSSLGVVVANYEKLAPYEAAYGLENNIWIYTWTAFIPRFLWKDKPIISDARGYSELYFNYRGSAFAMTAMGDLLRNFGPLGVPLGMALLGFVLRIIYAALIENQQLTIGRTAAYYMLLTSVSYEGFYGTILPSLIRVAFVTMIGLLFVNFLARSQNRTI